MEKLRERFLLWLIRCLWRHNPTLFDAILAERGKHIHTNPNRKKGAKGNANNESK